MESPKKTAMIKDKNLTDFLSKFAEVLTQRENIIRKMQQKLMQDNSVIIKLQDKINNQCLLRIHDAAQIAHMHQIIIHSAATHNQYNADTVYLLIQKDKRISQLQIQLTRSCEKAE
jgi:hypothetical protein